MKKKLSSLWPVLLSSLLFTGCTTTVTNLTPSTQKRNPSGLYPFEVALDTREQCIRQETLKPYVLIGAQIYAMQPTLSIKNRWETVVPIPANNEYVNYRFKFDYDYRSIPTSQPGSKLSRPFQLQIQDK
jgi:hypothetical protein